MMWDNYEICPKFIGICDRGVQYGGRNLQHWNLQTWNCTFEPPTSQILMDFYEIYLILKRRWSRISRYLTFWSQPFRFLKFAIDIISSLLCFLSHNAVMKMSFSVFWRWQIDLIYFGVGCQDALEKWSGQSRCWTQTIHRKWLFSAEQTRLSM